MKLIIQIPCWDEEEQLPRTLADLPRDVSGVDSVEWLVIDDGSTDRTVEVAREHGVDHIVRLTNNKGLAAAFETGIADTTSGFRAYNREAALQVQVVSKFTYTLETIIQAGKMTVAIDHVPIATNPRTRESRLFPSMWAYVRRNTVGIFRIYALYEPLRVFMAAAIVVGLASLAIWLRFVIDFAIHGHSGHIQSLILGAVLFIAAVQLAALGVVGDILAGTRVINQRILERVRRVELQLGIEPSHYEPGAEKGAH